MLTLLLRDWKAHARQPLLWALAAGFVVLTAFFFLLQLEHYQHVRPLLERQAHPPGASDLILVPWAFNTTLAFMVLVPMLAGRAFVAEYRQGLLPLVLGWRIGPSGWFLARWLGWLLPTLLLLAIVAAMPLGLTLAGPVDVGRMWPSLLAIALAVTAFSTVAVAMAAWVRDPAMAALAAFLLLLLFWILDWSARGQAASLDTAIFQLSLFEHFRRMNAGLIHAEDLAWFAGFSLFFIVLGISRLAGFRQGGWRTLTRLLPILLLGLGACYALGSSGRVWDSSWQQRFSLQPPTRALLASIKQPVQITAWASEDETLRARIRRFLAPWQRLQPLLQLQFRNPQTEADTARRLAIHADGTLLLRQGGREQRLDQALDERSLALALWRLQLQDHGPVAMLQCADCGGLNDETPAGFSHLAETLRLRGLQVFPLDPSQVVGIPLGTRLLIIPGPAGTLPASWWERVQAWLEQGGSLLWLADVEALEQPPALWQLWGIQAQAALHNTRVPPVSSLDGVQAPPALAGPLLFAPPPAGWQVLWQCRQQPCALLREEILPNARHARILLLGDSDVARNRWLNLPGYSDSLAPLLGWLLDAKAQFTLPLLQPPDAALDLPKALQAKLGLFWLLVVPLTLLLTGWILRLKPCTQVNRLPS